MTLFALLYTVFLLFLWLVMTVASALQKDNLRGIRLGVFGIGLLLYALVRLVVYFILWYQGVVCSSLSL